jgi:hypothetical protein
VVAAFVIRERRGISEEEAWSPTVAEIADYLDGLDEKRLRKLKQLAEGLLRDVDPPSSQALH